MPSIEKHIQLSLKRTGNEHREIHKWLDSNSISYRDRIARHSIVNIPNFLPIVERQFGKEGAREYLQHIKDDYENNILLRIFKKIRSILG